MKFSIPEHIKAELKSLNIQRECPICLENIPKGKVEITDCGHYFCISCIASSSNICPLCRAVQHNAERNQRTTSFYNDPFEDGKYEVVGSEVLYILPNGDCYALDPDTLSVPHTFVGRIRLDSSDE